MIVTKKEQDPDLTDAQIEASLRVIRDYEAGAPGFQTAEECFKELHAKHKRDFELWKKNMR
jgi:hypothetical protein